MASTDGPTPELLRERAVLGAAILGAANLSTVLSVLEAGDFERPLHGFIFDAMLSLAGREEPVTVTTVAEEMGRAKITIAAADLLELVVEAEQGVNVIRQCRGIAERGALRRLAGVGATIAAIAKENPYDVDGAYAAAAAALDEVGARRAEQAGPPRRLGESTWAWLDTTVAEHDAGGAVNVRTGWPVLDDLLGGLRPGELVIIGGRPAMAKSDTSVAISLHAAADGWPVLYVSLEMGEDEVQERAFAQTGRLDRNHLRQRRFTAPEVERLSRTASRVADLPIYIVDDPRTTLSAVRSAAGRIPNLALVVIDYVQLLHTEGRRAENRQVEVSMLSVGLKQLAREAAVPVLALSSLSRAVEQRSDRHPVLSDLRESGSLESDANAVVMLYRDEVYDPQTRSPGVVEFIVAKNRSGPTGTVELRYEATTGRLLDDSRERMAEPLHMFEEAR